jgi:hypothetical protein
MRLLRLALLLLVVATLSPPLARAVVTTSQRSVEITGTGGTVFTVPYPFVDAASLVVTKILISNSSATTLVLNTDYTVTLPVGSVSGKVTTTAPVTSSYKLRIERTTPLTQTTAFGSQGAFYPSLHEKALDKLTLVAQDALATQQSILTNTAPADVAAAADVGIATSAARADHKHKLTAAIVNSTVTGTGLSVTGAANTAGVIGTGGATNALGVIGQGAGTGAGAQGTGGATGAGVVGVGGATSGTGVLGTGSGGNSVGVQGNGANSGSGVEGYGGATNGSIGVYGTTSATNGVGVRGDGQGSSQGVLGFGGATGVGVQGQGGATSGLGGYFGAVAGNSAGLGAQGNGSGPGITSTGGGSDGAGVFGTGGTTNGIGVYGQGTGAGAGVKGYTGTSTGYAVVAEADTTSPVRAAFRIVPQDAEPTGPNSVGDFYVTTAGIVRVCTVAGSPGTWADSTITAATLNAAMTAGIGAGGGFNITGVGTASANLTGVNADTRLNIYTGGAANAGNAGLYINNDGNQQHIFEADRTGNRLRIKGGGNSILHTTVSAQTNTARGSDFQHETSADMVDGFGTALNFKIKDSAAVENEIANIVAVRDGADNSGYLGLWTKNAGSSAERVRIAKDGAVSVTQTLTSSRTTDLGWSPQSAANQACNTTCVSACVFGANTASGFVIVSCSDATADVCLCAGGS